MKNIKDYIKYFINCIDKTLYQLTRKPKVKVLYETNMTNLHKELEKFSLNKHIVDIDVKQFHVNSNLAIVKYYETQC